MIRVQKIYSSRSREELSHSQTMQVGVTLGPRAALSSSHLLLRWTSRTAFHGASMHVKWPCTNSAAGRREPREDPTRLVLAFR